MGLIKRLFGGAGGGDKPDLATPSQLDGRADSRPMEGNGQVATRRELLRVLTRDTQRYAGMPDGWIDSQVLLELGRDGQTLMHLRLVLKQWDENLLRYQLAFQRRLLAEVERFEPGARDWLLSITWQYLVDDQAPCLDLPDPATWGSPLSELPKAEQTRGDDVEQDLAQLFAVRDANMAAPSDPGPDKYHRKV